MIDIVCHGVPSPYVWRDYLAYLEKKHKSEICYVNFRDKDMFGWKAHKETFKFVNRSVCEKMTFTYVFYKHIMFRHSCGVCKYTNMQRPSDITIADFWGWEKTDSTINADDKGVSLVLSNTEKGEKLFEVVKNRMDVVPAEVANCLQPNLQHPSEIHPKRMDFEHDYTRKGFEYVMKKYGDIGWRYKWECFEKKMGYKINGICKLLMKK